MAQYLDLTGLTYYHGKAREAFVAQEEGKGLSANDFTDELLAKLEGVEESANNYVLPEASTTLGGVRTTSEVTDVATGYTAVPIVDGVPYYATAVETLGTETVGSTYVPVYLEAGAPTACSVASAVTADDASLVTSAAVASALEDYAKASDLTNVYTFKGTVATYAELPEDASVGDVYNVTSADEDNNIKAGDNVAWDGEAWDNLSGIVDLSNYVTTDALTGYVTTDDLSSYVTTDALSGYVATSDLEAIDTTDIDALFA